MLDDDTTTPAPGTWGKEFIDPPAASVADAPVGAAVISELDGAPTVDPGEDEVSDGSDHSDGSDGAGVLGSDPAQVNADGETPAAESPADPAAVQAQDTAVVAAPDSEVPDSGTVPAAVPLDDGSPGLQDTAPTYYEFSGDAAAGDKNGASIAGWVTAPVTASDGRTLYTTTLDAASIDTTTWPVYSGDVVPAAS